MRTALSAAAAAAALGSLMQSPAGSCNLSPELYFRAQAEPAAIRRSARYNLEKHERSTLTLKPQELQIEFFQVLNRQM